MLRSLVRLIAFSVALISLHAMTANASDPALHDTYWKLVSVGGVAAEEGRRDAHLRFKADGGLAGSTGCNNLGAVYTLDDDRIAFGPIMTTRMYCREVARTEREFLKRLPEVGRWKIEGNTLELMADSGVTLAIFEAKSA